MHSHPTRAPRLLLALLLALQACRAAAAEPDFTEVRGLVAGYCVRCHGDEKQKGGINLAHFTDEKSILRERKVWRRVVEQLDAGAMPPGKEKQPTDEQRRRAVAWVQHTLEAADRAERDRPDPGRPVIRRLCRSEYNRTVRDLTGIDLDVAGAVGMSDDGGGGFDNLAAALNLSDVLVEKYFTAADLVLEKLYAPPKGPKGKAPVPLDAVLFVKPDKDLAARDAARRVLERFTGRAYRRPVEEREVARLLRLYDLAASQGAAHEEALKVALKAVLVSPNFLLRTERDRPGTGETPYRVSDHELAVRLSYFLWSSIPDDELRSRADTGELSRPEVLEAQVRRLLAHPRARALTDNFAVQWLRLNKLAEARPSTEFFPTFTPKLRQAMFDEAVTFFDRLRQEDRTILELLDADYTYVNAELAKHYGIDGVTGPEFVKVKLPEGRGGLLGMAAVLTLTSHTSRTSPTLRGKYILDVILGTPPPPPPPDAGMIDENKQKGKSPRNFRELLALHASRPACASCHKKIDPLGFGLETFDAIGRLRPPGPDVDASGTLPGGEQFAGPKQLKQVLLDRKGQFVKNVTAKMLVYALGRELQPSDEPVVERIVADLEANEYRLGRLVLGIVRSYPFQYRRNLRADEASPAKQTP
jgi:mono/diheme cytochrome c family protein